MTGDDAMDMWDFLKWRRTLGYTQVEAANKLGVSRGTIQHWERGVTGVPRAVDLACEELKRRWKQQLGFGPVSLVYADGSVMRQPNDSSFPALLLSELYSNNNAAIDRAFELCGTASFINPIIMEEGGDVVWTTPELLRECERRSASMPQEGDPSQARAGPSAKQPFSTRPAPSWSLSRDRQTK